jgi:hypothetical protein
MLGNDNQQEGGFGGLLEKIPTRLVWAMAKSWVAVAACPSQAIN